MHFGLLCPALTGHLNTLLPLGQALQKSGHRVTLVGLLDAEPTTLAAGLEFRPIAEAKRPAGAMAELTAQASTLSGRAALRYAVKVFQQDAALLLREAPAVIKAAGIDALLIDQTSRGGGTVAEFLNLPFITLCSALVLNREPTIPPFNTSWRYHPAWWAQLRNRLGYGLLSRVTQPITAVVAEYRRTWNLPPHSHSNDAYSQLAQISQQPAELEFPRQQLPPWFHFTGPYHGAGSREPIPFPWEKLTGQPLIYASMGTVLGRFKGVFQQIATACEGLDAQLVISLGGPIPPETLPTLPGAPLVVSYAPQLELLRRAALTITHAGMNTTLESLSNGVPLVAIPIANDQPGVAARVAWTGAGVVVPLKRLRVPRLRQAIAQVLTHNSYRKHARRLQTAIQRAGGVDQAVEIIMQAVSTGKPVLKETGPQAQAKLSRG
ncbi:glycosyltransferase, MGT family [Nitrosococcus watsonii C-113]|uniref:Glycosyltransferase, MGT family n=2 Tax=Nitrosococcus TaxID=1227 RepID=D8K5S6_NITWC|nr:glycosyltransferase, MGT family [Nitrosococcus watsonii C-113]